MARRVGRLEERSAIRGAYARPLSRIRGEGQRLNISVGQAPGNNHEEGLWAQNA